MSDAIDEYDFLNPRRARAKQLDRLRIEIARLRSALSRMIEATEKIDDITACEGLWETPDHRSAMFSTLSFSYYDLDVGDLRRIRSARDEAIKILGE